MGGHEVAGDRKEDIDPDIAAGEIGRPQVVDHHDGNSERPQGLKLGAEAGAERESRASDARVGVHDEAQHSKNAERNAAVW